MNKPVLAQSKAITIFIVFALGYFISTLLRAITATKLGTCIGWTHVTCWPMGSPKEASIDNPCTQ